ncbi:MAG: hypothetical protein GWP02_07345 [Desulfobulbaceae bacterium]|nr:hypothetical protein [Desulfobulbaceae bacterium]
MYSRKIETTLALIGALIVLFGVGSAATTALADEAIQGEVALNSVQMTSIQE